MLRRDRLFRLALGCAFCASLAFLFLFVLYLDRTALETGRNVLHNPVLAISGAILSSVLFSALFVLATRRLLDHGPGFVLNASGLLDNSSTMPIGFVPWSDITGVEIGGSSIFRRLVVRVADPEKYMLGGNVLSRYLRRSAMKSHGSPILLNTMLLNAPLVELSRTVQQYFARYGRPA